MYREDVLREIEWISNRNPSIFKVRPPGKSQIHQLNWDGQNHLWSRGQESYTFQTTEIKQSFVLHVWSYFSQLCKCICLMPITSTTLACLPAKLQHKNVCLADNETCLQLEDVLAGNSAYNATLKVQDYETPWVKYAQSWRSTMACQKQVQSSDPAGMMREEIQLKLLAGSDSRA